MTETIIRLRDDELELIKDLLVLEKQRLAEAGCSNEMVNGLLVMLFAFDEDLTGKTARECADILVRRRLVRDATRQGHGIEITGTFSKPIF